MNSFEGFVTGGLLLTALVACWSWEIDRLVCEGRGDTGAQFQERCGQVALQHYWDGKHKESVRQPEEVLL